MRTMYHGKTPFPNVSSWKRCPGDSPKLLGHRYQLNLRGVLIFKQRTKETSLISSSQLCPWVEQESGCLMSSYGSNIHNKDAKYVWYCFHSLSFKEGRKHSLLAKNLASLRKAAPPILTLITLSAGYSLGEWKPTPTPSLMAIWVFMWTFCWELKNQVREQLLLFSYVGLVNSLIFIWIICPKATQSQKCMNILAPRACFWH